MNGGSKAVEGVRRYEKDVNPVIQNDIQRYKKNKLGLVACPFRHSVCLRLFYLSVRAGQNENYYYRWPIAIDVVYNLIFLLVIFLCSEQVKNYDRKMFLRSDNSRRNAVRAYLLASLAGITETAYVKLADVEYRGAVLSTGTFAILCRRSLRDRARA